MQHQRHAFVNAGLICESADYHNAVFVGRNGAGVPLHAHLRGTGSAFKGNVAGSDPKFSFHWNGKSDRLYLFEAPIDMLSFISLHKDGWRSHSYAAACGVSDQVLWQMLEDKPHIKEVCLCLDNDTAGQAATSRISRALHAKGIQAQILVPVHKDWNEDLLHSPEPEESPCTLTLG
ncbi:MAG: DUF3991 and TOPRIM domain-containing protein [Oscillospiraceae bacterium]|nr:DUF3991 and TOPRIM domain-containing protein [Oscillospiraceae bacterium]